MVLSTIASGYAYTVKGVFGFFKKTFYANQYALSSIKRIISKILQYLYDHEMVEIYGDELVATKFGRRVSELYIDPLSAVIINDSLNQQSLKLTNFSFLHLIMEAFQTEGQTNENSQHQMYRFVQAKDGAMKGEYGSHCLSVIPASMNLEPFAINLPSAWTIFLLYWNCQELESGVIW